MSGALSWNYLIIVAIVYVVIAIPYVLHWLRLSGQCGSGVEASDAIMKDGLNATYINGKYKDLMCSAKVCGEEEVYSDVKFPTQGEKQ